MIERTVIAKRTKYSPCHGRTPRRLFDTADLAALTAYCGSKDDPNHVGAEIIQYSAGYTVEEFIECAERGQDAFLLNTPRSRGRKIGQRKHGEARPEIAEHDVFSLPPGSQPTAAEREQFAREIAASSAYDGFPVLLFGHFLPSAARNVPAFDLHVVAANFDQRGRYRITRVKKKHRDYAAAIARAADSAIAKINQARVAVGRPQIKSFRERRDEKRTGTGRPSIQQLIAQKIPRLTTVTASMFESAARELAADGWKVETDGETPDCLLLTAPGRKKRRKFNLSALFFDVAELVHERDRAEHERLHEEAKAHVRAGLERTSPERRAHIDAIDPLRAERAAEEAFLIAAEAAQEKPVELLPPADMNRD